MSYKIDINNPQISEENILKTTIGDLDDFYVATQHSYKQYDLFFALLTAYNHYTNIENWEIAAHVAFLMAYYLFIPLTPENSLDLAYYYINKAVDLNPREEYLQWRQSISEDIV